MNLCRIWQKKFVLDTADLSTLKYKLEAAAYGATLGFIEDFLEKV